MEKSGGGVGRGVVCLLNLETFELVLDGSMVDVRSWDVLEQLDSEFREVTLGLGCRDWWYIGSAEGYRTRMIWSGVFRCKQVDTLSE